VTDLDTATFAYVLALEGGRDVALRAMEAAMDERNGTPRRRVLRRRALDRRIELFFDLAGAFTAKAREQREAARAEVRR
jgi:hypothetical protein